MSKEKKAAIIGLAAFVVFIIVISIVNKYSSVSSTPKKKCDGSIIIGDDYQLGACYDNIDIDQLCKNYVKLVTGKDREINLDVNPQNSEDIVYTKADVVSDGTSLVISYKNWNVDCITIAYSGFLKSKTGEYKSDEEYLRDNADMIHGFLYHLAGWLLAVNGENTDTEKAMAIYCFYAHLASGTVDEFPENSQLYYGNTVATMDVSDMTTKNIVYIRLFPVVPEVVHRKNKNVKLVDLNKQENMNIVYREYGYENLKDEQSKQEQTTKASSTIEETKSQATENYQKKETKESREATVKQNTNKQTTKKETRAVETTRAVNKYNYSGTRILLKQGFTYTLTVDSYSDTHAKGSVNVIANDGRQSSIKFDSDISDNCLTCEFANDGRDNSGSLELIFQDKNIYVTITQSHKANISYPEGKLEFTN